MSAAPIMVLSPLRDYERQEVLEHDHAGRPVTVRLPGGYRAYYMRTELDCLVTCLATLAQAPYDSMLVPPPPGSDMLAVSQFLVDLGGWAHARGYRLTYHASPCFARPAWIGCIPADELGQSHGVLMCQDRIVFDPASNFPLPPGHELVPARLEDIKFGITLERES